MRDIYIITGANGHLGSTIIRTLKKQVHSHSSRNPGNPRPDPAR